MRCLAALLTAVLAAAPALAQDPLIAFPENYKRLFQNAAVDVLRVHYGPNERVALHDHSAYPTLYVYLNNSGPVLFEHHEPQLNAITRPPTIAGGYRLSSSHREHHSVQNLSATPSDFLRVELKERPLGSMQPFRGAPPPKPTPDTERVEIEQPGIRIDRLLCTGKAGPCTLKASPSPSLLIALSSVSLVVPHRSGKPVEAGNVRWLTTNRSFEVSPRDGTPAQILRVSLPAAR